MITGRLAPALIAAALLTACGSDDDAPAGEAVPISHVNLYESGGPSSLLEAGPDDTRACPITYQLTARETPSQVLLTLLARHRAQGESCVVVGSLLLPHPVAGRALVDATNGRVFSTADCTLSERGSGTTFVVGPRPPELARCTPENSLSSPLEPIG